MMHLFPLGWALSLSAIILQLAVFLQPFLPQNMQVAVLCETITGVLEQPQTPLVTHEAHHTHDFPMHDFNESTQITQHTKVDHRSMSHDAYHHCPFCTVYSHLIAFLDLGLTEVFVKLSIRLLAFICAFKHIYFDLQRLFLIPQGRAPPRFS
ncbi:DUF2946 domain-containing protein [Acinetobacter baretiae]|uniref:DUF2946 domain-containing protein n=1 Tax=Acinetobacter baretiae TaxID=2605383 RepID=UPI0038B32273